MLRFVSFIAISWLVFSVHAQPSSYLSKPAQEQLKALYKYEHLELFEIDNDEAYYLKSYQCFLTYLASEDEAIIDSFMLAYGHIKENEFLRVNAEIQKAILLLLKGDEMLGVYAFYRAHQRFKRLKPQDKPIEYKKLEALFYIILAQVPESYQFWSALLGLQGKEKEGFELLRSYLNDVKNQDGIYIEGLTLYNYLLLKFSEPSESDLLLVMDEAPKSGSPLFYFVGSQVLLKVHKGQGARNLLSDLSDQQLNTFPLLYYIKGRLSVNQLQDDAVLSLDKFEAHYRGSSFKTDAKLRLSWYYHLNQQYSKRDSIVASFKAETALKTALDQQALKELERVKNTPKELLKARLLFDDGDFNQALQVLESLESNHIDSTYIIEYYYRLARVEHELKNYKVALDLYSETIAISKDDKRYFGPYAAIKAALISYAQTGDLELANSFLKQAEELNNGEYQSSIKRQVRELESSF